MYRINKRMKIKVHFNRKKNPDTKFASGAVPYHFRIRKSIQEADRLTSFSHLHLGIQSLLTK